MCLRKPPVMRVCVFTTRLIKSNMYLPYFLTDHPVQLVLSLHDDEIKEFLYHAMPNLWEKKFTEHGYNYLDGPIQSMAKFFKVRIEY